MKSTVILSLVASAMAVPLGSRDVGLTANELVDGGCRDIILVYARGTNQDGNMGKYPGPKFANLLKANYGDDKVAVQGVDYPATYLANIAPDGTDRTAINKIKELLTFAVGQCPGSKIVMSGFSQGAAVVHAAGKYLPADVLDKIDAAVTFGDTRKTPDGGRIPNFPPEKTLIICNEGDVICDGILQVLPPHRDYDRRAPEAADFVIKTLADA